MLVLLIVYGLVALAVFAFFRMRTWKSYVRLTVDEYFYIGGLAIGWPISLLCLLIFMYLDWRE